MCSFDLLLESCGRFPKMKIVNNRICRFVCSHAIKTNDFHYFADPTYIVLIGPSSNNREI